MSVKQKYVPLLLGIALAIGIFIGGKLGFTNTDNALFSNNSSKEKLNRLFNYIEYDYVDDVNTDSIVDVAVNGILANLDPHSVYIPKENLDRVAENMKGDFVGIGVNFYVHRDSIAVIKTIKGGPSDKAGIKGGDRILIANSDTLYGSKLKDEDVVKKLKGPKGSDVRLTIYRQGTPNLLNYNVERDVVPIRSVDATYMLTNVLGYVKINRFAETTYKEFKVSLDSLLALGAKEIVLDLRNNPGGYLGVAEKIVDEFLEDGKLILFTKNKRNKIEESYATNKGDFEQGNVYVLINENSASASEIIAGALQDNDKGTIIGRRSFGKGLVQREMGLGDGSAIRLTVSRYYTPTGRSIQRPYNNGSSNYYHEYIDRIKSGELTDSAKIQVHDSLKFKTPKGKTVYGGGGIIPDVFVALDNGLHNKTIATLWDYGYFDNFIFRYLDKDRHAYNGISRQDFINYFEVSDSLLKRFEVYVDNRTPNNITFNAFKKEVKHYLKATLGEQLFDGNTFYEVLNKQDIMIETVVKLSKKEAI